MRRLRVVVLDLVTKGPTRSVWARVMHANFASIMPQAIALWCEEAGHDVRLVCYTGFENLERELPDNADVVFIGAFSHAAQLAYALSNLLRHRGTITVLGGPHARCYPEDAVRYFDYVLGFTDRSVVHDVLQDCTQHAPQGVHLSAPRQPTALPGVRERWTFIEPTLDKAPIIKIVPMLGSLGCPYTCSFCIDSVVPYQQLSGDLIKEDLRFLLTRFRRPRVGWHDPNFGVRFTETLDAIEEAVRPGSIDFFAESSLSLLSEPHLQRLRRNGFKAILPGIESWYDMGNKSKTGKKSGLAKVETVAEHINLVLRYIPYLQANFVVGLDVDEGPEPFELTKRFVDLAPGAYPAYSLLSAFGRAAPLNLEYQKAGRVLPFPFHFLNTQHAMNVRPRNYGWTEFYRYLMDLVRHTFSRRAIYRRYRSGTSPIWSWMNVLRGVSAQGIGRVPYYQEMLRRIETDREVKAFHEQQTTAIPRFYLDWMRRDLGPLWEWLPREAIEHDPNAYLQSHSAVADPRSSSSSRSRSRAPLAARPLAAG